MADDGAIPPLGTVTFDPIGVIRSGHVEPKATPIQPPFAEGSRGRAEILPEYEPGLDDIEGFSHLIILYHLHRAPSPILSVKPFLEDRTHGVFATRHPRRPNPIGLSIVRLEGRAGNVLFLNDVDILDGTPILDIKPYVSRFDQRENVRDGWIRDVPEEEAQVRGKRDHEP